MHDRKVEASVRMVAGWSIRQTARREVADALQRTERTARLEHKQSLQVLALRRYLRLQDRGHVDLRSIWPWSQEQVRENLLAGPARLLMDEAARVQAAFARNNPGYSLGVSPPRSLASQVEKWVTSTSAQAAGKRLLRETSAELAKPIYELSPPVTRVEAFAVWLRERLIEPEPGNAAPGTSDHGQMRAVDFVVMRDERSLRGLPEPAFPANGQRQAGPSAWRMR